MSQSLRKPSDGTFEENVRFLKDFIVGMREGNRKAREVADEIMAQASAQGDSRLHNLTSTITVSLQNGEGLYLIADYLLNVLESQDQVNRELLGHIKNVAGKRLELTPAIISEIVKAGFEQLAKESEERTRRLAGKAYS